MPGQKLYIRRKCMRANGQNRGGALLDLSKRLTCSLQILTAHSARACMMCVYATDGHKNEERPRKDEAVTWQGIAIPDRLYLQYGVPSKTTVAWVAITNQDGQT